MVGVRDRVQNEKIQQEMEQYFLLTSRQTNKCRVDLQTDLRFFDTLSASSNCSPCSMALLSRSELSHSGLLQLNRVSFSCFRLRK